MTCGMKREMLRDNENSSISISSEIGLAAFTGATLDVLNWWIENGMTLSGEEVYNEIKQVLNWMYIEKIHNETIGKE